MYAPARLDGLRAVFRRTLFSPLLSLSSTLFVIFEDSWGDRQDLPMCYYLWGAFQQLCKVLFFRIVLRFEFDKLNLGIVLRWAPFFSRFTAFDCFGMSQNSLQVLVSFHKSHALTKLCVIQWGWIPQLFSSQPVACHRSSAAKQGAKVLNKSVGLLSQQASCHREHSCPESSREERHSLAAADDGLLCWKNHTTGTGISQMMRPDA